MLRFISILALASALLCAPLFSAAKAEESWVAISTGTTSTAVYYGVSRAPTREEAENSARNACLRNNKGGCSYAKAWDFGCIYGSVGYRESDGKAFLGTGPTKESAIAQCEKRGSDCSEAKTKGFCVLPTTSTAPKGEAARPSLQEPGTTTPTIDSSPPSSQPKVPFPTESMALLRKDENNPEFVLCPNAHPFCYKFTDGEQSNKVTETQLTAMEKTFKGVRAGAPRDDGYTFDTLYSNLNPGRDGNMMVRYQFGDIAVGVGRLEGLMCIAEARQERKTIPTWITCAYVMEIRKDRSER